MNAITTTLNGNTVKTPRSSFRNRANVLAALAVGISCAPMLAAPTLAVVDGLEAVADGSTYFLEDTPAGGNGGETLTIRNVGDEALIINSILGFGGGGAFFVQGNTGAPIAPSGFAVLSIGFTPDEPGDYTFQVSLLSNDPNSPLTFTVEATAVAPALTLADGLVAINDQGRFDIGETGVGSAAGAALTVRNVGDGALIFGVPRVEVEDLSGGDAAELEVGLASTQIQPNGFAVMTLNFTPTTAGEREFSVTINSNDLDFPEFTFFVDAFAFEDCNANGTDDASDVFSGDSIDCDDNGTPDECQADADGDGAIDACDQCAGQDDFADSDGDTVVDCFDNCPTEFNTSQADADGNGVGDACDVIDDNPIDDEPTDNGGIDDGGIDDEPIDDGGIDDQPIDDGGFEDEPIDDGGVNDGGFDDHTGDNEDIDDGGQLDDDTGDVIEERVDDDGAGQQLNDDEGQLGNNDTDLNDSQENDEEEILTPNTGLCGSGVLGGGPLMMMGLCGMRSRRIRGRKQG